MNHPATTPALRPLVCVVGSCNIDLNFRTPRLPTSGETLFGRTFQIGFGGKGANQAVMAARLDARVAMIARVGADVFGDSIRKTLADERIDTSFVTTDLTRATGVASITIDDNACNSIIVVSGANFGLTVDDVENASELIRSTNVVVGQLEVPIEVTMRAFCLARAAKSTTILNPAPAMQGLDALLQVTDYCIPNETELDLLTGQNAGSVDEIIAAARTLNQRGPKVTIVTLGANGAVIVGGDGAEHIPAPAVAAVDTTGAGDAFTGSLAVFLAERKSLPAAVALANHVAAQSVTRPGTQASYLHRAELGLQL